MNIPNTPDVHHQAMGRAVRQGNEIDRVNVYKYFTGGTFDEFMDRLISGKSDWIESLSNTEETDSSVSVNSSSSTQIISEALNMFKGQGLTQDEAVKRYMDYQVELSVMENKAINSIKIKKDIQRLDHLLTSKRVYTDDYTNQTLSRVTEIIQKFKTIYHRTSLIEFSLNKWDIMDLFQSPKTQRELKDITPSALKKLSIRLKGESIKNFNDVSEEHAKLLQELKDLAEEDKEYKRILKLKKAKDDEKAEAKRKLEQNETFRNGIRADLQGARFQELSAKEYYIMREAYDRTYNRNVTEDELIEGIKIIVDKAVARLEKDLDFIYEEIENIDSYIERAKVNVLAKKGDDDYDKNGEVTYQGDTMTIEEVIVLLSNI